jgi:AraC-like DNA-binding protein
MKNTGNTPPSIISITTSEITAFPIHSHKQVEITCVLDGKIEAELNLGKYTLYPYDVLIAFPYDFHSYTPLVPETRTCKVIVDPSELGVLNEVFEKCSPSTNVISSSVIKALFPNYTQMLNGINNRLMSESKKDVISARCDFAIYLSALLEKIELSTDKKKHNDEYFRVVKYCSEHYTQLNFNLKQLADDLSLSTSKIQRLFKKYMGIKFKDYIAFLRMEEAKILLTETDMSITTISFNVGFSSLSAFSRTFKRTFGYSSSDYRRIVKSGGVV